MRRRLDDLRRKPGEVVVVGFGSAGPPPPESDTEPSEGVVYAVYVHPEAWGRSAAQPLLRVLETRLIDAGCTSARLDTLAGNARARRFYEKAGWRTDGHELELEVQQPGMPSPVAVASVQYRKAPA